MTDNDIIRGIRENSDAAWRDLFARTHGTFASQLSLIMRNAAPVTFEDIYEQACIDLMQNVKDGKLKEGEDVNLAGYLYRICVRKAERAVKNRQKEMERIGTMQKGDPEVTMEFDPDDDAEAEDSASAFLDKVLASIPKTCRQLLRRYYWDKMSMKDIATAMGLKNADVAKATKSKCMNKFKDMARAMLADDEKAEEAVRRTIERDALRDLLEECRNEASGDWAVAALKDKKDEEK